MAADSFKITDRRASHESKDDSPTRDNPVPTPVQPSPIPTPDQPPAAEVSSDFSDNPEDFNGDASASPFTLSTKEIAQNMVGMLIEKSWVNLGLVANPVSGKVIRDLGEAHQAIDLLGVLAGHLKGKWGQPGIDEEIQGQLSNLRLNFSRLSGGPK